MVNPHPKNMKDFNELVQELDLQTFEELDEAIKNGKAAKDLELGTLLSLGNFSRNQSLVEVVQNDETYNFDWGVQIGQLMVTYGIKLDTPASLLQTFDTPKKFLSYISKWHKKQKQDINWNPPYAKVDSSKKIEIYCRKNGVSGLIKEFNIVSRVNGNKNNLFGNRLTYDKYLLFPFDGWTLAHYLKIAYKE